MTEQMPNLNPKGPQEYSSKQPYHRGQKYFEDLASPTNIHTYLVENPTTEDISHARNYDNYIRYTTKEYKNINEYSERNSTYTIVGFEQREKVFAILEYDQPYKFADSTTHIRVIPELTNIEVFGTHHNKYRNPTSMDIEHSESIKEAQFGFRKFWSEMSAEEDIRARYLDDELHGVITALFVLGDLPAARVLLRNSSFTSTYKSQLEKILEDAEKKSYHISSYRDRPELEEPIWAIDPIVARTPGSMTVGSSTNTVSPKTSITIPSVKPNSRVVIKNLG